LNHSVITENTSIIANVNINKRRSIITTLEYINCEINIKRTLFKGRNSELN